ncbi:MAG: hypothetical protein B7Z75_13295 [Acidocella sp. 20-57-95]|nr:MAG: hypothetical protein B7Z75_13295 [Acidocella sp. 20-57-95]OYV58753.1 MAG: hypothetical protein B7Z71_09485 [Acidocella sp. 21-58-7]HQT65538.1 hypothetical protein [Acidocella sp.]
MADLSKFKKGRGLGAPPSLSEASQNLAAPEVAPTPQPVSELKNTKARKIDGRTLRKTNRTVAFATRVTENFDNRVREIAEASGLKIVEVLEAALEAYDRGNKS